MDHRSFNLTCLLADQTARGNSSTADYCHGYRSGLRRGHYGDEFNTPEVHARWMELADSNEPVQALIGRGYRDGIVAGAFTAAPSDPRRGYVRIWRA